MSTLQAWLDARTPEAPPALRARIAAALVANPAWAELSHAEALLQASKVLLREVLAAAPKDRAAALALLAADACVTYAFEAASEHPDGFCFFADESMRTVAQLAD